MVTVRRAHEKARRPDGARRGREPGVPISIYHELDEVFRQIQGLQVITSTNRETILRARSGITPVAQNPVDQPAEDQPYIEEPSTIGLFAADAFAQQARSTTNGSVFPFIIEGLLMSIEVQNSGGANYPTTIGVPKFFIDGNELLGLKQRQVTTGTVILQYQSRNAFPWAADKVWAPTNNIIGGFDRIASEDNTKVSGTVLVTIRRPFE